MDRQTSWNLGFSDGNKIEDCNQTKSSEGLSNVPHSQALGNLSKFECTLINSMQRGREVLGEGNLAGAMRHQP